MIYDTFLFFDEFDVLDIRLRELWDVVDCFVIGEATKTFAGQDKPLRLKEYNGFGHHSDKIRHVVIDDFAGAPTDLHAMDRWQKARLLDALHDAQPNDLVIYADCDEIVRADVVRKVAEYNRAGDLLLEPMIDTYYYWLNCVRVDGVQSQGVKIGRWKTLQTVGPERLRRLRGVQRIHNAGWHFSFMSPDIPAKLAAYAHAERNRPPYNTPEHIAACRKNGIDLFGRHQPFWICPSLKELPRCVQENPDRYRHLLHEVPPPSTELPEVVKTGSHQPVLEAVLDMGVNFALELGVGFFSTRTLLGVPKLWSVEQNPAWLASVALDLPMSPHWRTILHYHPALLSSRAGFMPPSKMPGTLRSDIEGYYRSLRDDVFRQDGVRLLFVDNFQCCRRPALEALATAFDVVVLHDSEPANHATYECDGWIPEGWESLRYNGVTPHTTCAWKPLAGFQDKFHAALQDADRRYRKRYLYQ
ncbi:MAG: hypothetical protein QGD94_06940 [Planctomycetia bacterium]|nr:hypothetical protein [Planctomycetia bacterium]